MEAAAILSKAPNDSCSLLPLTFLIELSANLAKPILCKPHDNKKNPLRISPPCSVQHLTLP